MVNINTIFLGKGLQHISSDHIYILCIDRSQYMTYHTRSQLSHSYPDFRHNYELVVLA